MSFENRRVETEYGGQDYAASTNPDGSITYWKRSAAGRWYEVRPDSRDPWLRSVPRGAARILDARLARLAGRENPQATFSDTEMLLGGISAIVLTGFGMYLVYSAVNPPGQAPDTTSTLEDTSSLAALALVV